MANLLSFFGGDNTILILIVLFFLLNGGGGFFHNDDSQLILILLIVLFCFCGGFKILAVKHKKALSTWIPSIRDFFISLTALRDRARSLSPLYLSRLDIQAWVKPSIVPNITIPPIK